MNFLCFSLTVDFCKRSFGKLKLRKTICGQLLWDNPGYPIRILFEIQFWIENRMASYNNNDDIIDELKEILFVIYVH